MCTRCCRILLTHIITWVVKQMIGGWQGQGATNGDAMQHGIVGEPKAANVWSQEIYCQAIFPGHSPPVFPSKLHSNEAFAWAYQLLFQMDASLNKLKGRVSSGGMHSFSSISHFTLLFLYCVAGLLGGHACCWTDLYHDLYYTFFEHINSVRYADSLTTKPL